LRFHYANVRINGSNCVFGCSCYGLTIGGDVLRAAWSEEGEGVRWAKADALEAKLATANTTIEGQRTLIRDTIGLVTKAAAHFKSEIGKLRVAPGRKAHSGASNDEYEAARSAVEKKIDPEADAESKRADLDREAERLAEMSTGKLS
jgi:hypothetical protein